jgi:uncharacterized protein
MNGNMNWLMTILCLWVFTAWTVSAISQDVQRSEPKALNNTSSNKSPANNQVATKQPSLDEQLLFFPTKHPSGNWKPTNLQFEDIYFTSEDGTKLHGWYCPCEKPRGVVLLAHGNAGNVSSRASWLRYLQNQAKLSVLIFDYRGYGRSEGVATVEGVLKDSQAARAKLCELAKVKPDQLILMGESLGGAIAIELAADVAPRALIVQSTFSSLRDVADVHYPKLSWLVPAEKLNSVDRISKYRGPLLQSHGSLDRTIPFRLGQRLFQAANEPKQFVEIKQADHNDWLTDTYKRQLDEFISNLAFPTK